MLYNKKKKLIDFLIFILYLFYFYSFFYRAFPSTNNDTQLALSFIDWAPNPADNSMGLWQNVSLSFSITPLAAPTPALILQNPSIQVTSLSAQSATVQVSVELWNLNPLPSTETVLLNLNFDVLQLPTPFSASFKFSLNMTKQLVSTSIVIPNPVLWWPWNMLPPPQLSPYLYSMGISQSCSGADCFPVTGVQFSFGLRTVSSAINAKGYRQFYINDLPFTPIGAGGCPDLFLRFSTERTIQEFALVRFMGLNTIRLEGKFPMEFFYEEADRIGIMIMVGFECCDSWQRMFFFFFSLFQIKTKTISTHFIDYILKKKILALLFSRNNLYCE